MKSLPESINFHITERCNYRCKFCFARYRNHRKELSFIDSCRLIKQLMENGCQKLNFAGGEPTLIKHLPNLINYAKDLGLFVSIISNGKGITKEFLRKCGKSLDILGLSVDSSSDIIERELGRWHYATNPLRNSFSHINLIKNKGKVVKEFNINLKINSTITPLNWKDDMHGLMTILDPVRWKVLEVHPIQGINDDFFKKYGELESWQFESFIKNHSDLNPICEKKEIILDSYCMITPDGHFYQNTGYKHNYSQKILKVGPKNAFKQLNYFYRKYNLRKGNFFKNLIK